MPSINRTTLTELHRSTGDIITAAAYGFPALVEKRGDPFVLILPAKDLKEAANLAAEIAEQEGDNPQTTGGTR